MNPDLEIARAAKLRPIQEIAAKLGIPDEAAEPYGRHKAKIGLDFIGTLEPRSDGALVLVTGISPTPAGEGKTTTTVGLGDALNRIGKHAAIAEKIARIAAETFAMESMTLYAASLVDRDKHADVRLEAAMCKLWATERCWEHVNETMQIRGGRGYETAQSLAARGEEPVPIERLLRDSRINMIFEGSSEIMRLFIAREALDPHLKIGAPMLDSRRPLTERAGAAVSAASD